MKQYEISHPAFLGKIVVRYDEAGTLCLVDSQDTNADAKTMARMMKSLPATLIAFLDTKWSERVVLYETGVDVSFNEWYNLFNNKQNTLRAKQRWDKLTVADRIRCMSNTRQYLRHLEKCDWKNQMSPDRYLKDRAFETDWSQVKC